MRKFEVELAICISYGDDNGPWHVETVEVEMDVEADKTPSTYEFLEAAENAYYAEDSHVDENIVAMAFYAWSEVLVCEYCGQTYNVTYGEECENPDCPGLEIDKVDQK